MIDEELARLNGWLVPYHFDSVKVQNRLASPANLNFPFNNKRTKEKEKNIGGERHVDCDGIIH